MNPFDFLLKPLQLLAIAERDMFNSFEASITESHILIKLYSKLY